MSNKFALLASFLMLASTSAFADGGWAAIVFNPTTGSWGSFHGSFSRADAETQALALCGADCANVDAATLEAGQSGLKETYVYNGWIAYARGNGTRWATSGVHDSQYDAEETAFNNCGGTANNCGIVRSLSSYSYQADVDGTNIKNETSATPASSQ